MKVRNLPLWVLGVTACLLILDSSDSAGQDAESSDRPAVEKNEDEIRQAPVEMKPNQMGIGRMIADVSCKDIHGKQVKFSDFSDKKGLVIILTGTGCPLCKKFAPTLVELEKVYSKKGFAFLFVNPTESETLEEIKASLKSNPLRGHYIHDKSETILHALETKTTTEAFVLDPKRTLVYRGAVDDQYGLGYTLAKPRKKYLADALNSILAGERPAIQATTSPGCELLFDTKPTAAPQVTYHNRISRIVQDNCMECHRENGPAPFGLEDYASVKDYAGMISNVVKRGVMPPWFAKPEPAGGPNQKKADHALFWANDRSLSESEKKDLLNWIKNGAPEGDSADAPVKRTFHDDWTIGKPDASFEFERAVKVKATGIMPYKNVYVKTDLEQDQWVQGIEVIPGEPEVVHHILVFVYTPEEYESNRREREAINYWGIYVPGNRATVYPEGYARKIPKGAVLQFQVHYTPNGTEKKDKTKIGLKFAKAPPKYVVRTANITNTRFVIPANEANQKVEASIVARRDVLVLGYLPHHHLRGIGSKYELIAAGNDSRKKTTLLTVPNYDFNWQLFYRYAEPRRFSKGDTLLFTAWYNNSKSNPAVEDPGFPVTWGEQTEDEMHVGYVEYVVKRGETSGAFRDGRTPRADSSQIVEARFYQFDRNHDEKIELKEILARLPGNRGRGVLLRYDQDKNGSLDKKEFLKIFGGG